jgi:catechol 2,3-dioxygenase-like lactoylglutathione lyase family enzyme
MSAPPALGPLHQVGLSVDDLDAAVEFYRDRLGLRLIARFDPPGLAFFDLAGTRLMLGRNPAPAAGSTLYLRVDDIDAAHAALAAGGLAFEHPPAAVHRDDAGQFGPAGQTEWMAFFRDPAGNLLALVGRR